MKHLTAHRALRWPRLRMLALAVAALAALAWPAATLAHEGHSHTVRGTVTERTDSQLSIKQTDGKTIVVKLNPQTTFLKGTQKVDAASAAVGQRVIADVGDGKTPYVAKSVKLGTGK